ncbi:hypothetical protein RvY_13137-2 [Ramazzottius varieornatus]|uniref:G-protein coupled receptors family 1 profile domain-containing protein n=1 Tax=Ramazzottius varieornatus TaxID=947166 RepID=A0A1D1VUE6_RAMVA|nr:hypothetical protein RvY_13137-2 [Ramazzottius varieornatus]
MTSHTVEVSANPTGSHWNESEDADCRLNYTIVLLFLNATNPDYFRHRTNDIIILFSLAVLGVVLNLCMAWSLMHKATYKQSANGLLALQLSFADLLVALFCLTSDGIWNVTMQWLAGNLVCRFVKYMQMFSQYATTLMLTGMTVERCITVTFPISRCSKEATMKRAKYISIFGWVFAGVCSIPQAVIFHVERAPICVDFFQCVTHGFYTSDEQELAYTMTTLCLMFLVPLLVICVCYVVIFASFSKEAQQAMGDARDGSLNAAHVSTKRTEVPKLGRRLYRRARRMSLWMTFAIALTFVICWTPYYIGMFTHFFSWETSASSETISSMFYFGKMKLVFMHLVK